ncbi:hypothetical protein MTO98_07310 [Mucilaginibacter sp. SMC90]|uniref:hypothetical protein n=1 Tax=Mucilaginibacter sp. SMC90 TaxID=2929803 RepID=UPI001FB278F7|nr:hypothetical protein [Mucilaginibacter sp. SMC90]UOE50884.1 hypothetical protein MTO98_07310 [Mucilaginibacter sp. SMC90]
MKLSSALLIVMAMLASCSARKTVCITNKTGHTITLLMDSSYSSTYQIAFADSLNGLRIEKKKVFDYGFGKWTKNDKTNLEEVLRHTRIIKDGSKTAISLPGKTEVSHISFNVEELWVNIK